uniref:Uncharacterized protein n=1 Tax=Anguilla anguilla TaxID=7936 RepID=A0A0E9QZN9_ANGAN
MKGQVSTCNKVSNFQVHKKLTHIMVHLYRFILELTQCSCNMGLSWISPSPCSQVFP